MDRKAPILCAGLIIVGALAITPVASAQLANGGFLIHSVDDENAAIEAFAGLKPTAPSPGGPVTPPVVVTDTTVDGGKLANPSYTVPFVEDAFPRIPPYSLRTMADGSTVVMGLFGSRITASGVVTTQRDVWKGGADASVGPDGALYAISGHSTAAKVERVTIESAVTVVSGELPEGRQMLYPSANKIFVVSKSFYSNVFTVSEVSNGNTRVIHSFDASSIVWALRFSFSYTMLDDGTLIGFSEDRSQIMYFKPDGTVDELSVGSLGFPANESVMPVGVGLLDGSVAFISNGDRATNLTGTIKIVKPDGKIRTIIVKNAAVYRVGTNAAGDITATIHPASSFAAAVKIDSAGKATLIAWLL